jgi:hypothetical protein
MALWGTLLCHLRGGLCNRAGEASVTGLGRGLEASQHYKALSSLSTHSPTLRPLVKWNPVGRMDFSVRCNR